MIAHLVNQFTVLVGQTALVFLFMILVFNIHCEGSLPLAIFITLLQGLCGMCYGKILIYFYCCYLYPSETTFSSTVPHQSWLTALRILSLLLLVRVLSESEIPFIPFEGKARVVGECMSPWWVKALF